jgi:tetratricopeptide (TPR) repeat protein
MNTVIGKSDRLLTLLALVAFLAGCQHLNAIRLEQDQPGDLEMLLENRDYGRAEQLLHRYPSLDTPETRSELNEKIGAYETAVLSDARARESANDLYGAHELLVAALLQLPDSPRLTEYNRQLEAKRSERLRDNERRELLAQAEYYVAQLEIYNEQLSLDSPTIIQRLKNSFTQQQAESLAGKLLTCGQETLQQGDTDTAEICLHYAQAIKDSPEAQAALAQLESRRAAQRLSEEKKVLVTQIRKEKKLARKHRDKIQDVLEKTERALNANDLARARRNFSELPKGGNESHDVAAMRERLNEAIQLRVHRLTGEGDSVYRADNVSRAIHIWEQALELDPDNPELTKRLERARKVLARLEELKNRQRAPVKQPGQGT